MRAGCLSTELSTELCLMPALTWGLHPDRCAQRVEHVAPIVQPTCLPCNDANCAHGPTTQHSTTPCMLTWGLHSDRCAQRVEHVAPVHVPHPAAAQADRLDVLHVLGHAAHMGRCRRCSCTAVGAGHCCIAVTWRYVRTAGVRWVGPDLVAVAANDDVVVLYARPLALKP